MSNTTTPENGKRQELNNKNDDSKENEMIEISIKDPNRPERPGPEPGNTKEFKSSLILRSFNGYTGEVFKMVFDVDTGTPYLIQPDLEGVPDGYTYIMISVFRDQFGELQMFFIPDPVDEETNVWGETVNEFIERSTKEWVVLPGPEHGPVTPKFDLPDPVPFDFSYEAILEIYFRDYLIDSLDHPVLLKLAEWNGKVA